jgi:hypothetical protein
MRLCREPVVTAHEDVQLEAILMTNERLRISFSDLPARTRSLDDEAISRVFGGCVAQYASCRGDSRSSNCCQQTMNDTGSGRYKMGCVGFTSGTDRICDWVQV